MTKQEMENMSLDELKERYVLLSREVIELEEEVRMLDDEIDNLENAIDEKQWREE